LSPVQDSTPTPQPSDPGTIPPGQGYDSGNPGSCNPGDVSSAGFVQLPRDGTGYHSYAASDDMLWGTPNTVARIKALGVAWAGKGYGLLYIGYISYPDGRPIGSSVSHRKGVDFDIKEIHIPAKQSGSRFDSDYSQSRTRELIQAILNTGSVQYIFFNDPTLINEFSKVQYWDGHDDHLHVRYYD